LLFWTLAAGSKTSVPSTARKRFEDRRKASQGRRVEVCKVSAYPGGIDVEDHARSLDHCGIWIHDQNLSPLRGLSRKELQ